MIHPGPLPGRPTTGAVHDRGNFASPALYEFPRKSGEADLSVPRSTLGAVARALPSQLRELAELQSGVLTGAQAALAGLGRGKVESSLRYGHWQRMRPGVYATFSGEPPRIAVLWAAVLSAGQGAMLSYRTAAELSRLSDLPSELVHVTIPTGRRVRPGAGIVIHRSGRAADSMHPVLLPPQTRIEETVLDLAASAASLDNAIAWLTTGLGRRLTTQAKLGRALELRGKMRWRPELAELLTADATGLNSVLEWRYHRNVELPHSLPACSRQVKATVDGQVRYRDLEYEAYALVVELDGRLAHPGDTRWSDVMRDNAAAAEGKITLRYGWFAVTKTPCVVAAEVARVLRVRGYTDARPCSATCPVGADQPFVTCSRP